MMLLLLLLLLPLFVATGAVFPKAIQFSTFLVWHAMAWFCFFPYRLHFKCFREREREKRPSGIEIGEKKQLNEIWKLAKKKLLAFHLSRHFDLKPKRWSIQISVKIYNEDLFGYGSGFFVLFSPIASVSWLSSVLFHSFFLLLLFQIYRNLVNHYKISRSPLDERHFYLVS